MYPYINIGQFNIPTYGLCMAVALVVSTAFAIYRSKKYSVLWEDILIVTALALLGALAGAKILYILVSFDIKGLADYIKTNGINALMGSGLVFYGGLIGGIIGAFAGLKLSKADYGKMSLCVVPAIPVAYAIGRIGCLLGGCCYGIKYEGPLHIHISKMLDGSAGGNFFPVQLVDSIIAIIISAVLCFFANKENYKKYILEIYLVMYSVVRFMLEFLRGDVERGSVLGISTSQFISICVLIFTVICLLTRIYKKDKIIERQ